MTKPKDLKNKFPDRNRLDVVFKRLSSNAVLGSSLLPDNASPVDRTKFKACESIIKYRQRKSLKQKDLAVVLEIDEARMSEILHYKIDNFTLDRLVGYAQILYPNLKLTLEAA